jgi:hypothetical protein
MYLQNPHALAEHVRLQQEELLRNARRNQLASQRPWQPTLTHRLLGRAGAALMRAGTGLQRFAGQRPPQPVRI